VLRDIRAGQAMLRGRPRWQRGTVGFMDNNIGGSRTWLRELCDALEPLRLRWAGCITFNVLRDEEMLDRLAASGCGLVYVGLESFNPAALADMRKLQNAAGDVRRVVDACRARGILLTAGLMLSPSIDTIGYIDSIPQRLAESGLHVPTYISFETPIPGTPHFARLAQATAPAMLPGALLRDFTGYTLVTRPAHASAEAFVAAYRRTHARVYSPLVRARKLLDDLVRLVPRGHLAPAIADIAQVLAFSPGLGYGRTLVAGTDTAPPETVPLATGDFADEAERDAVMRPWAVTDGAGRVLPQWLDAQTPYRRKGRMTAAPVAEDAPARAGWPAAPAPSPA
jgi:hypothetical protein